MSELTNVMGIFAVEFQNERQNAQRDCEMQQLRFERGLPSGNPPKTIPSPSDSTVGNRKLKQNNGIINDRMIFGGKEMTVTLELSPETAERLEKAKAQGVDIDTILNQALINQALPRKVVKGYGKLAHVKRSVDDFLKERHEDIEKELKNERDS